MYPDASAIPGGGAIETRKYSIGATIVAGQVVCKDTTAAQLAEVLDPIDVNTYSTGVGANMEANTVTYTTTQGTGADSADRYVKVSCSPFQRFRGRCSGGVTVNTALAEALDGNLLTNTTASAGGIVITDADVGSSDFIGGFAWGLNGNNKGKRRIITSHIDATSETVTVPFDYALAVNDRFVRTFGFGNQGLELTTDFTQFNMVPGAGVNLPDTGNAIVWDVFLDINNQGTPTAPIVEVSWLFSDHVFNSLA